MSTPYKVLREAVDKEGGYRALARKLNVPVRTLWRTLNDPEYEPKRADIREKLGLPELVTIQVRRDPETGQYIPIDD